MWWWGVLAAVVVLVVAAYLLLLAARVSRLHLRAASAASALDASLVRRAAAAAVLAEELGEDAGVAAADLFATAHAALDADPADREVAENDLTQLLRKIHAVTSDRLAEGSGGVVEPAPAWPAVVTASRRAGLARQVHTDAVRDALTLRRRIPVRALGLARRHDEPTYFDVGDPEL
jgi:hypothetical protein